MSLISMPWTTLLLTYSRDIYFTSRNERFCLGSPENIATASASFTELQNFKVRYPYSENVNDYPQNSLTFLSLLSSRIISFMKEKATNPTFACNPKFMSEALVLPSLNEESLTLPMLLR